LGHVDNIIVLRTPVPMAFLHDNFRDAKFFLWLHDLLATNDELLRSIPLLEEVKPTILGVSQFHKTHIIEGIMRSTDFPRGYKVDYVYNPVDDLLVPDYAQTVDLNKVVFFSSPHKGLEQVLTVFDYTRERLGGNLTLYIANPGYHDSPETSRPGVVNLGKLPHAEIISHVR